MQDRVSLFTILWFWLSILIWTVLCISFLPVVSLAQEPTATVKKLSGDILIAGQMATIGTVLQTGDTIQTQAGASVVLELSDGSTLELGENTCLDMAVFTQEPTGARVSRIKLLWGRIRAKLSLGHQEEGSSFEIETSTALVGVKFSHPDVEVWHNPETRETTGIAHSIELWVKNLLTGEIAVVPVGSSIIISATGMKVLAGIVTATGTSTGATGTGMIGISTKAITVIGVGVAAAGGVVAVVATSNADDTPDTAESTGDLSGVWDLQAQGVSQGCTVHTSCMQDPPYLCGTDICGPFTMGDPDIHVTQSGNTFSASETDGNDHPFSLNGSFDAHSVSFTIEGSGITPGIGPASTTYTGTLKGNTIQGTFSGSASWATPNGETETATWDGTFTVTISR